jgi:sulfoxide reductase heme-binding subunit YedZ
MDIKQRLWQHYLPLLVISLAVMFLLSAVFIHPAQPYPGLLNHRICFTTGYTAFLWIGITLLIGTWRLLRGRPNPPNHCLRRDIGIWAGMVSCVHGWTGLHMHMRGKMYLYFFKDREPLALRGDTFGWANDTGILALVLVIVLMLLSNDHCIRKLGLSKWKNLQRFNYLMTGLVVAHTIFYYLITKKILAIEYVFYGFTLLVVLAQLAGICVFKRKTRMEVKAPVANIGK